MGPRAGLDGRKNLVPTGIRYRTVQPVVSRYTDELPGPQGCVILIAFPLRQWVHERSSVLRYTYVASLVCPTVVQCGGDANQNIAVYDFYQTR